MDPFAPFTPKNTANPLLGGQKGASPKAPAPKAPPKAAPPKAAAVKAPVAKTPLSPFSPKLPSTSLPGSSAVQKGLREGAAHPNPPTHHSLFSLHTLESGAQDVGGIAGDAFHSAYGTSKGTKGGAEAGRAAPGAAIATPINSDRFASALGTAIKNTPGSAVRSITGVVPGIVDTGKAAVDLAQGKPAGAEAIAKSLGDMALHPLKSFEKEPVAVGLMAAGAEAGAGTAAGEAMRSGALGEKAAAAADTARPALKLYNDMSIPREYSPDIIRKGAQVAADKFREKVLNDPDVNLATGARLNRHIYGGGLLGQHLERGGVPLFGQQGFFKPGQVDVAEAASKNIRHMYTSAASGFMEHIKPKGSEEAVPLAVEGTIRTAKTAKADLEKRLTGLREEAANLTGNEARLNKAQQDQITGLLSNRKFLSNPQAAIDAAKEFTDHQEPLTDRKIQLGAMEPDQMHAKMVPYATQHMGAEYNLNPGKHPLVATIRTLERREKAASRSGTTALLSDVRGGLLKAKHDLAGMKESGLIKANGDMHPRLESGSHDVFAQKHAAETAAAAEHRAVVDRLEQAKILQRHAPLVARTRSAIDLANRPGGAAEADAATRGVERLKARLGIQNFAHIPEPKQADAAVAALEGEAYRTRSMLARAEKERLDATPRPLTYDEIDRHAKAAMGDREIGFLTHKETTWGSATHSKTAVRPAILKQTRTGVAYKTGTYDSSWDALKRQAYKDVNEIAGHEGKDEIGRRLGFGSYHGEEDAATAADNFNHTPEGERVTKALGEVVPWHAGPDRVINRANMPSNVASQTMKDFGLVEHKAIQELGPEGKWRIMPKAVVDRIDEHDALNNATKAQRALQSFTNKWRSAALFTSPRWPVGTTQENMIRLAFNSINPFAAFGLGPSVKLGRDLTDHFRAIASDPAATEAQRFAARAQVSAIDAGSQYGGFAYTAVHRDHADTLPPEAKTAMEAFNDSTPISKMIDGWNQWKGFVGHGMRKMETNSKNAMLGKVALKESKRFTGEWKALLSRQDRAVKAYAEGKLSPATSAKLGDDIMNMAGNWTTLTPAVRRATQTWSPFGLWWLNSMKFVFKTLPKDHPFKTAALAAMMAGTGATKGDASQPEYLAGGVGVNLPIVGHVTMTPLHYSPFGIGVEPLNTAAGMVLPQLSDPVLTALGINPLSYQSATPSYEPPVPIGTRLAKAGESLVEGVTPGLRPALTVAREGGTANPASALPWATKPGTKTGILPAVAKEFAPFPFTANRSKKTGVREVPVKEKRVKEVPIREVPVRER